MKRFLYSVLVLLLCTSCESLLDLEPKNGVTFEHYFATEQDLEAAELQVKVSPISIRMILKVCQY